MIYAITLAIIFGALVLFVFVSKVQEKHFIKESGRRINQTFTIDIKRLSVKEVAQQYQTIVNRPAPWPLSWYWKIMGYRKTESEE